MDLGYAGLLFDVRAGGFASGGVCAPDPAGGEEKTAPELGVEAASLCVPGDAAGGAGAVRPWLGRRPPGEKE